MPRKLVNGAKSGASVSVSDGWAFAGPALGCRESRVRLQIAALGRARVGRSVMAGGGPPGTPGAASGAGHDELLRLVHGPATPSWWAKAHHPRLCRIWRLSKKNRCGLRSP